jgi:hypothetical protein
MVPHQTVLGHLLVLSKRVLRCMLCNFVRRNHRLLCKMLSDSAGRLTGVTWKLGARVDVGAYSQRGALGLALGITLLS